MADTGTSEYTLVIGGVEHTVLLSEEDAKRYDAKSVAAAAKSRKPANKAATPANK